MKVYQVRVRRDHTENDGVKEIISHVLANNIIDVANGFAQDDADEMMTVTCIYETATIVRDFVGLKSDD